MANRVAAFSLQRNSHLSPPASSTNNAERSSPALALKVRSWVFHLFVCEDRDAEHWDKIPVLIENGGY